MPKRTKTNFFKPYRNQRANTPHENADDASPVVIDIQGQQENQWIREENYPASWPHAKNVNRYLGNPSRRTKIEFSNKTAANFFKDDFLQRKEVKHVLKGTVGSDYCKIQRYKKWHVMLEKIPIPVSDTPQNDVERRVVGILLEHVRSDDMKKILQHIRHVCSNSPDSITENDIANEVLLLLACQNEENENISGLTSDTEMDTEEIGVHTSKQNDSDVASATYTSKRNDSDVASVDTGMDEGEICVQTSKQNDSDIASATLRKRSLSQISIDDTDDNLHKRQINQIVFEDSNDVFQTVNGIQETKINTSVRKISLDVDEDDENQDESIDASLHEMEQHNALLSLQEMEQDDLKELSEMYQS